MVTLSNLQLTIVPNFVEEMVESSPTAMKGERMLVGASWIVSAMLFPRTQIVFLS